MKEQIALLEEGDNWENIQWLVDNEHQSTCGSLVKCCQCEMALGLLLITRPLKVKKETLFEGLGSVTSNLDLPEEFPLSTSQLLSGAPNEKEKWKEGYPVLSESQEKWADESRRLMRAMDEIVEGEDEYSLMLAPGFDRFEDGHFEKRQGPLKEHSHFQQRLASLKMLVDMTQQEVDLYTEALKNPDNLEYPDLVESTLKSNKEQLEQSWYVYWKAKQSEYEYPTQPYWVDTSEVNLSDGIKIVCPRCGGFNTLKVEDKE